MRDCFRILTFPLALAVVAALGTSVALAQSTLDVTVNQTAATTCPSGEPVTLSGGLHFTYSFATDPTTGINTYQVNIASNLSGVGQNTQSSYAGSGSYGYGFSSTASPAQVVIQLGTRLASQDLTLMLDQTVNIMVDTAGNMSASLGSASTTCAQ